MIRMKCRKLSEIHEKRKIFNTPRRLFIESRTAKVSRFPLTLRMSKWVGPRPTGEVKGVVNSRFLNLLVFCFGVMALQNIFAKVIF